MQPQGPAPAPTVMVWRLTSGFLVQFDNGNNVACSNTASLNRALRNYLTDDPPLKVVQPSKMPPDPALAVVPTAELQVDREAFLRPETSPTNPPRRNGNSTAEVNPLLVQENLMALCEAYAGGKINEQQWEAGLDHYCPTISMREARLTLASYTGIPEPPAHRARPQRDEQDHYKLAPDIDKEMHELDPMMVMDLVENIPTVTGMPVDSTILEHYSAQVEEVAQEEQIKDMPATAEEWMMQPL
jgi:hypothetical protein